MNFQKEKIRETINNLERSIVKEAYEIEGVGITGFCSYKKDNTPPALSEFRPYNKEFIDFPADSHLWLHLECDVPDRGVDEKTFLRMTTGKEGQWDACNPQCSVFVNGKSCTQAFDTNHTTLLLDAGHNDIYIYFYSGKEAVSLRLDAYLIVKSMAVEKLWFDMKIPYDAAVLLPTDSFDCIEAMNALDMTSNELDFREKFSDNFFESVKRAEDILQKEYYQKLCGKEKNDEISFIGHTHIDVAWLWTLSQTAEKAQRSFSTVIKLMEQYPEYIFISSQPQLYAYVKENDPELYEKIKQRVSEGRWEPEGAMWLEADTNITGGESLIRQIMYGKRFMKDEFGVENKTLWLPDVFGYSAALPQILKKCGVDNFFTSKINWNETNKFPHDTFIWKGIDGSEVFAVFAKNYVNMLSAKDIKGLMGYHIDKKYTPTVLAPVGFGDGGGGVTFEMLENFKRFSKGLPGYPKVTMRRASDTISKIKSEFEESTQKLRFTPKWSGELYLEMHRGTYTTQARNKKNNRKCELLLQKAEAVSAAAGLLTGFENPKEIFDKSWEAVLRNQFHDIIPGSSIKEVYEDSGKEYEFVIKNGTDIFNAALSDIAWRIKTDGGHLVYNPTGFELSDVVKVMGKDVAVKNIPAHGYAVVKPESIKNTVFVSDRCIENDKLKVTFDKKYEIVSIYDKENCRELIKEGQCGNVLNVYEDYPRDYDAWEITEYYKQKKWCVDDVTSVSVVKGDLSGGFKVVRKYGKSTFTQCITLKVDSRRLDFETEIDWQEDHVLLKAEFPFDIHTENVNCDIQYGNIQRPTHMNTPWDRAKFEICCHKWADLSEGDYGVSLLNDCKYGYSAEENKLAITLLKAPTYPDPTADRGVHTFTYSVFPHKGCDLMETVKEGYKLNNPMTAVEIEENKKGKLPEVFSLASVSGHSAVIDTVKVAEDGKGIIVRIFQAQNTKENITVNFGFDVKEVYECDCLENNGKKLKAGKNSVELKMGNFEIKTLRVVSK